MLKIEKLFGFIAKDEAGNEGIAAFLGPGNVWMPMIGADMARVEALRIVAKDIATMTGQKLVLCEFSIRTEMETFEPQKGRQTSAGNPNAN